MGHALFFAYFLVKKLVLLNGMQFSFMEWGLKDEEG
jgi:hypothetical protein